MQCTYLFIRVWIFCGIVGLMWLIISCVLLAAPNQFATPAIGSQPAVSSNGMPFMPQPVNYPGMPQQFVPASYGFYAPPMMQGAPVSAGFPVYASSQRQVPAASGAPATQGSNSGGLVGAGTQPAGAQPAAGSWSMQMPPVVNPFLVSLLTLCLICCCIFCLFISLYIFVVAHWNSDHKYNTAVGSFKLLAACTAWNSVQVFIWDVKK